MAQPPSESDPVDADFSHPAPTASTGLSNVANVAAWPIRHRLAIAGAVGVLLTAGLLSVWDFRNFSLFHKQVMEQKLAAVAGSMPYVLPHDFHTRIFAGESISDAEHRAIIDTLTGICESTDLPYIYTYIVRDDKVYLTAANQTPEMIERDEVFPFLMHEFDPPPGVKEAIADGEPRFETYATRFGSFRSYFLPVGDSPQTRYVVGTDVSISVVLNRLYQRLGLTIGAGLIVSVLVGGLFVWRGSRIVKPIGDLADLITRFEVAEVADNARVSEMEDSLHNLARNQGDESGRLAQAIIDLRKRMASYLTDLESATRTKQRVETQLEIARQIQKRLLPSESPSIDGMEIVGWSEPADEVGGDFYDWIDNADGPIKNIQPENGSPTNGRRVVVMLGDATGHGMGPALTVSTCRAHAREVLDRDPDIARGVERLNRIVAKDLADGQFVTFVAAVVKTDGDAPEVELVSAGHGPLLVYHAATGEIDRLHAHAVPLGMMAHLEMDAATRIRLEPGDAVILVSDGLFEYARADGEQMGVDRLCDTVLACQGSNGHDTDLASRMIDAMRDAVRSFAKGHPQDDDMTAVVIRRRV